jgi:histidinol-phosphate/aromatic aminotransferase/cobyric acid decarboxylase-like protein
MDPAVADIVNRVRQPFNVNALAQAAAIAALADSEYVAESRRLNRAGVAQLDAGPAKTRRDGASNARELRADRRRRWRARL